MGNSSLLNAEKIAFELFGRLKLQESADYYLAFSGGKDSCVLLDLMSQIKQSYSISLTLLHFDHGLQSQSIKWSQHCLNLAKRYDLPIKVTRKKVTVDSKKGLEATARIARYDWFTEIIANNHSVERHSKNSAILLTAHHINDQAETLLLNLMRGTGVRGLRGIARKKQCSNHILVRPLVDFDQQQISHYAIKHSLQWIDDPSNKEQKFRRNAIRAKVIPFLTEIKSDALQQFGKSSAHMVAAERLLTDLAEIDIKEIQQIEYFPLDQSYGIDLHNIKQLGKKFSFDRQSNVLRYWLRQCGYPVNSQQDIQQILDWSNYGTGDKSELRSGTRIYRVYRNHLFVMPFCEFKQQIKSMVWPNMKKPLTIKNGGYELSCENLSKAQQYDHVQLLFGEAVRLQFSMKKRFQSAAIPHWRRDISPVLIKDGEIIAIAGSVKDDWLVIRPKVTINLN